MKRLCQSRKRNRSCTMRGHLLSVLLLVFTAEGSTQNRFFISAPNVFHVGVNEKVVVQMGEPHFNNDVTLYLESEKNNKILTEKKTVKAFTDESQIKVEELKINWTVWSTLAAEHKRSYVMLVAESPSFPTRQLTRVLVSKHRGYIFIQTDQPMYNPEKQVKYRVFTLDHTMRPHEENFFLSVFNPDGSRILKIMKSALNGIFRGNFPIPSDSKTGTWKITAHYEGDEENAASREFEVQKFVLPTFEVSIEMEQGYILLDAELPDFTILAKYSYGEKVEGAYHCSVGVVEKSEPNFIKGMEAVGSIKGAATVSLQKLLMDLRLKNQTMGSLSDLIGKGKQLYVGVFVTNIRNGEIQEAEVYLPIVSHKYSMDVSRTRSHFVPGNPLDVVVLLSLPDGSPAVGVPVGISLQGSSRQDWEGSTDQEGAVSPTFNLAAVEADITVEVSASGLQKRIIIRRASSPSNSYLYLTYANKLYSVNNFLTLTYNVINGPTKGYIYYMVLSRGTIIQNGSLRLGTSVKQTLQIMPNMVPSFRVIGYYHNQRGDIIADSVWVDVRDECEIKVKVDQTGSNEPGKQAVLQFDLHNQQAKVALLAVDKAFYALNVGNRLTSKQVFSSMKSYDLGCSYSGGSDSASVLMDAGLSFVSQSNADWRKTFGCKAESLRKRRSVNLGQELTTLKSKFNDTSLQDCCVQGFSVIPMKRTCQERMARVRLVKGNSTCVETFLHCCLEGERLRQKKMQEDADKELGRTMAMGDIEQFFLDKTSQYIRRHFPPSFEFKEFDVNGKKSYPLRLPDSITTWEIQVVTLSAATGFCVVKPTEVKAFKESFVSLRLPYSVKKYEQLSISPVIYNYGEDELEVAVHMEQSEGLCSPGSATITSFVNVTVEPQSSQFVSFSAVPMVTGEIPIRIRLYHREQERGVDAIEKILIVETEGIIQRQEETRLLTLDGRSTKTIDIDGTLPNGVVPDSISNIFVSMEGEGFGNSYAKNLLSPEKVAKLITLPGGCVEQTMGGLVPTALAIRYLDSSDQWFDLPPGKRDDALDKLEKGSVYIIDHKGKNANGAYKVFSGVPYSNWITAYIVKVLSMVAQRQMANVGQQGRKARYIPLNGIRQPVHYLMSVQKSDGSFSDGHPVLHREVLKGRDQDAFMTSFITIALQKSLEFLETERRNEAEARISRATSYLLSHINELYHPFAVAITAYCLSLCMPKDTNHLAIWTKLNSMAIKAETGCYLWTTNTDPQNIKTADAISIEMTAYALLAAVELGHMKRAEETACWLTTQERFYGGYSSTQDTMMALEALAEYELKRELRPEANVRAEFTAEGKSDLITLELENEKERVETELKKLTGKNIVGHLTGKGVAKIKILKTYHVLDSGDDCAQLSISVTVEGKVKYTAPIMQNYDYYDYGTDEEKQIEKPGTATESFDALTRKRRDLDNVQNSDVVTYKVRVSHSLNSSLTGMAIADITLLSGFEAEIEDLERLKLPTEQYITHYEVSFGRVLIYFNELYDGEAYIEFDAVQRVPVGLLQPATAVFYDYYEPNRKCTVFYSAPQRSKLVSKLCSGDVCQCAERPCHKLQETFKLRRGRRLTNNDRLKYACFSPRVDYAYMVNVLNVSVKSNFELYTAVVINMLKSSGDILVSENSLRVFAVRLHCKGRLDLGESYLLMGKDGSTTDSNGAMQYLLESNTWVEKEPSVAECEKTDHVITCNLFSKFLANYKTGGCTQ